MSKRERGMTGYKRTNPLFSGSIPILWIMGLLSFSIFIKSVHADEKWTGHRIMNEVLTRHELFPYVFEKQTMILIDSAGNRDVRKLRRFSRVEKDGTVKYLLVFDNPMEVRGVALLAVRQHSGGEEGGVYLPAFGKELKPGAENSRASHLLGTDFTIEDLTVEVLQDFRYIRLADKKVGQITCLVVEALPRDEAIERITGYRMRRHFIRQDNFFIIRTDYYDSRGRFFKRQTYHDLKRVDGKMWRADMILMENHKERHKTLIKINQRVFSHDYVPPKMFTSAWLLDNQHIQSTERLLFRDAVRSSGTDEKELPEGLKKDPRQGRKAGAAKNN